MVCSDRFAPSSPKHPRRPGKSRVTWVVEYGGGLSVECLNEVDAKKVARGLHKRHYRVAARTVEGVAPARRVEPVQIKDWLAE